MFGREQGWAVCGVIGKGGVRGGGVREENGAQE